MFERFTSSARAAVEDAQQIARDTATRSIDTRHLLIALVERPGQARHGLREAGVDVDAFAAQVRALLQAGGIDADALAGIGIDLEAVRRHADVTFGSDALERAGRKSHGHIPFAREAKRALQLALREAVRLKERQIDGRHIVLGVLRADCQGRDVLNHAGADTETLRTVLEQQPQAA